jgi:hypothetical protein
MTCWSRRPLEPKHLRDPCIIKSPPWLPQIQFTVFQHGSLMQPARFGMLKSREGFLLSQGLASRPVHTVGYWLKGPDGIVLMITILRSGLSLSWQNSL